MANSKISMPEMTLVGYGLRFFQDAKAALAETVSYTHLTLPTKA